MGIGWFLTGIVAAVALYKLTIGKAKDMTRKDVVVDWAKRIGWAGAIGLLMGIGVGVLVTVIR